MITAIVLTIAPAIVGTVAATICVIAAGHRRDHLIAGMITVIAGMIWTLMTIVAAIIWTIRTTAGMTQMIAAAIARRSSGDHKRRSRCCDVTLE